MNTMTRQQTFMQNNINQLLCQREQEREPSWNNANEPHDQVRGVKLKVPEFDGDTGGNVFLDWIHSLESFIRSHNMREAKKLFCWS